jgi:hypothetical protein
LQPTGKLDLAPLCRKLVCLDNATLASFAITLWGELLGESIKPECAKELTFESSDEERVGNWVSICVAVMQNLDHARSKIKYIAVARENYEALLIPLLQYGLILKLTLRKKAECVTIYQEIISEIPKLLSSLNALR